MKVLSLLQPWASLLGWAKLFETRSWATLYQGPMAIHASKGVDHAGKLLCANDPWFRAALRELGCGFGDLPRGAVVAVGQLVTCIRTDSESWSPRWTRQERAFGNFAPGRVAWKFQDVDRLIAPFPLRGAQGIRDLDPEIARAILATPRRRLIPMDLVTKLSDLM